MRASLFAEWIRFGFLSFVLEISNQQINHFYIVVDEVKYILIRLPKDCELVNLIKFYGNICCINAQF